MDVFVGVVQVQHVEHQGQLLLEQRLVGRVSRCAAGGGEPAELGAEALVHGEKAAELLVGDHVVGPFRSGGR
jgi:hypothetical protein